MAHSRTAESWASGESGLKNTVYVDAGFMVVVRRALCIVNGRRVRLDAVADSPADGFRNRTGWATCGTADRVASEMMHTSAKERSQTRQRRIDCFDELRNVSIYDWYLVCFVGSPKLDGANDARRAFRREWSLFLRLRLRQIRVRSDTVRFTRILFPLERLEWLHHTRSS